MKRQYYTLRLSSRNTASYKIVCSRATLINIWVSYLLIKSKKTMIYTIFAQQKWGKYLHIYKKFYTFVVEK